MNSVSRESIREVYSSTAKRYEMILRIYRVLGVNLKKWRDDAFARLPSIKEPRIVDVAVGTGVNIPYLVEKYPDYKEIVGIDYTPEMLARAKKRIRESGWSDIRIQLADAKELSQHVTPPFDLVISTYSLSIIPGALQVLEEIRKVLDAEGYLMLLDCQKFTGFLALFNPLAIWLSKQLGGNEETYSVPVSEIASNLFVPVSRKILYSGLFYEDIYRAPSISTAGK